MSNTAAWAGASDATRKEAFQRALDVAGAGSVLLQTFINRVVQQIHLRQLGVSATLPRRPGQGNGAYIVRRVPGGDASWVDDTDTPAVVQGTYPNGTGTEKGGSVFFPYKTLLTRGQVTRFLQAIGRSYGDSLATEISGRVGDFGETFENGLVQGQVSGDPKQFDGLLELVSGVATQVIPAHPAGSPAATSPLTIDRLDEAIDAVKGSAARQDLVIYASYKGRRLLNSLLQSQQQFNDMVEIDAGFRVRSYDGIPIVTCTEIPDDSLFNPAGSPPGTPFLTAFTGEVANPSTSIIVVNTRYTWIEELTPMTVMPLAKSSSQFDEFDIFWDGVLVTANQLGQSLLLGIAVS